jgi:hypothetical protein
VVSVRLTHAALGSGDGVLGDDGGSDGREESDCESHLDGVGGSDREA